MKSQRGVERIVLSVLSVLSVALLGAAGTRSAIGAERPNVLFIMSDDHAYQAISSYGGGLYQTPHIDRLAKEGMRFDRCFVTNSICGPCRATILTGKYNHLNGFRTNGDSFDGRQQTFPKLLQKAGYQTAVIGKWHLVSDPTGFDHWQVLNGQGPYYNPLLKSAEGNEKVTGYTTDIITDRTLEWLEKGRDPNKPFCLMCQHKAPHRDWEPAPRHFKLFADADLPEPKTLFDDYATRTLAARDTTMTIARHLTQGDLKLRAPGGLTPEQLAAWNAFYEPRNAAYRAAPPEGEALVRWKYQQYIKDYLRCIAAVDENVGRVLDYLDRSGLAKNTVVVYTSDQGFYLGEHGWYDKRWMYEESFRTPLLVRWPGVTPAGSVNRDLTMNLDFAQTFLDLAGVAAPDDMQGRSLTPVLKGETPDDWRKSIYYHYYEYPEPHRVQPHYGVRTARHKLIYFPLLKEWELYDLETDPQELKNLAGQADQAALEAELKAELGRLRKQYGDEEEAAPKPKRPDAAPRAPK